MLALALLGTTAIPGDAGATIVSRVFINGRPTQVYFNDGDSFRQLDGPWSGRGSRLAGFNTLESFGPTHAWGDWHPFELWILAKQATYHARQGEWHCFADGSVDGYGRVLLDCPDLVVSQLSHGYAHAMQVRDIPAPPAYLRAQHEAIRERRGIWRHGVPEFVMTSIHSSDEDPGRDYHYNRLVSSRDGHSERWMHEDRYTECDWYCAETVDADDDAVERVTRSLRADRGLAPTISTLPNLLLTEIVDRYARLDELPEWVEDDVATELLPRLQALRERDALGSRETRVQSCMNYTSFRRRYGRSRASCLRERGTIPPTLANRLGYGAAGEDSP